MLYNISGDAKYIKITVVTFIAVLLIEMKIDTVMQYWGTLHMVYYRPSQIFLSLDCKSKMKTKNH